MAKLDEAWLQLTGWDGGNEVWLRADTILAVVENPAPRSPASNARGAAGVFPGFPPAPGNPYTDDNPNHRPYTRIETANGAYRVRESIDDILGRIAETLSLGAPK